MDCACAGAASAATTPAPARVPADVRRRVAFRFLIVSTPPISSCFRRARLRPTVFRSTSAEADLPASFQTVVPFSPRIAAGMSGSAQITALPPVARAKSCAASTFGPIDPAGKSKASSASGVALRIARRSGLPQSR